MRILGINALFHDPAAALVIDGRAVAAAIGTAIGTAEEKRFSRRKHGKRPVPFAAWELPEKAAARCLPRAGPRPRHLDAVTCSYDPELTLSAWYMGPDGPSDHLRRTYAREAPGFLRPALPGLDPGIVLFRVADSRIAREGPFSRVWVRPAAGDAGTALRGALLLAAAEGEEPEAMPGADPGRDRSDAESGTWLKTAGVPFEWSAGIASAVARALADNDIVAWFQGRSEYGPRAPGHRSLLAHPGHAGHLERLNDVKGREQFRPVAPMVLADRAGERFDGQLPSPYPLLVHDVAPEWREWIPAVEDPGVTAADSARARQAALERYGLKRFLDDRERVMTEARS